MVSVIWRTFCCGAPKQNGEAFPAAASDDAAASDGNAAGRGSSTASQHARHSVALEDFSPFSASAGPGDSQAKSDDAPRRSLCGRERSKTTGDLRPMLEAPQSTFTPSQLPGDVRASSMPETEGRLLLATAGRSTLMTRLEDHMRSSEQSTSQRRSTPSSSAGQVRGLQGSARTPLAVTLDSDATSGLGMGIGPSPGHALLVRQRGEAQLSASLSDPLACSSPESFHTPPALQTLGVQYAPAVVATGTGGSAGPTGHGAVRTPSFFARQAAAAAAAAAAASPPAGLQGSLVGVDAVGATVAEAEAGPRTPAQPQLGAAAHGAAAFERTSAPAKTAGAVRPSSAASGVIVRPASTTSSAATTVAGAEAPAPATTGTATAFPTQPLPPAAPAPTPPAPRFSGFGAISDMTRRLLYRRSESSATASGSTPRAAGSQPRPHAGARITAWIVGAGSERPAAAQNEGRSGEALGPPPPSGSHTPMTSSSDRPSVASGDREISRPATTGGSSGAGGAAATAAPTTNATATASGGGTVAAGSSAAGICSGVGSGTSALLRKLTEAWDPHLPRNPALAARPAPVARGAQAPGPAQEAAAVVGGEPLRQPPPPTSAQQPHPQPQPQPQLQQQQAQGQPGPQAVASVTAAAQQQQPIVSAMAARDASRPQQEPCQHPQQQPLIRGPAPAHQQARQVQLSVQVQPLRQQPQPQPQQQQQLQQQQQYHGQANQVRVAADAVYGTEGYRAASNAVGSRLIRQVDPDALAAAAGAGASERQPGQFQMQSQTQVQTQVQTRRDTLPHAMGSSAGRLPRQVSPEVSQVAMLQMLHFGSLSGRVPLNHLATLNVSRLSREIRALHWIGQGGGGAVFQGVWQGAPVAVKFMLAARPEHVDATALEAIVSLAVGHPNVVTTYAFDVTRLTDKSFHEVEHNPALNTAAQLAPHSQHEDSSATALYNALMMETCTSPEPSEALALPRTRQPGVHQGLQTGGGGGGPGGHPAFTRKNSGGCAVSGAGGGGTGGAGGSGAAARGMVSRVESLNMRVRKAQAVAAAAATGSQAGHPNPADGDSGGSGGSGSQTSGGTGQSGVAWAGGPGAGGGAGPHPAHHHDAAEGSLGTAALESAFNSEEGFGEPDLTDSGQAWTVRHVLTYLKARPGMYMTHIIMEYCDRGSLQSAIKRGIFRMDGLPDDPPHPTAVNSVNSGSDGGSRGPLSNGGGGAAGAVAAAAAAAAAAPAAGASVEAPPRFTKRVVLRALLRTARDIAQGMSHLHANGIIHGDLKPGNVLLRGCRTDRRGFTALVSDFGLSKITRGDKPLELNHWSTVTVMAPEVIMGRWLKASDVFSFGILMWQLVTGEMMPYGKCTVQQVLIGVSQGVLKPEWPASCHPALSRLGRACLATSPEKRPSFEAIVKILTKIEQNVRNELRAPRLAPEQYARHSSGLDSSSGAAGGLARGSGSSNIAAQLNRFRSSVV